MKIALLSHVRQPIAPPFMGGMESHSWHLAAGLVDRGHDVTLFASGDSDPRFTINAVLTEHYERTFPWAEHKGSAPLIEHVDKGYAAACDRIANGGFDVVHNNSLHRYPLDPARTARVPTVTSLHVPPYDALHWFVKMSVAPAHRLTVTSHRQLAAWFPDGAPAEASVLHNGIEPAAWPFTTSGEGAVWCGRITPNKGTGLAVQAALRAGVSLTIFGSIEDPLYWRMEVEPFLGPSIRYGGHLVGSDLAAAMGRAAVFVFTPCWDEPFGLVAIEAMSCGLPVAAFDAGAAQEVVGEAGHFAMGGDVVGLAAAIRAAMTLPRAIPRNRVGRLFTRDLWLDRCEGLYASVIDARASLIM